MKQVFKFDKDGVFLEPVILEPDADGKYSMPENVTMEDLPQPNWRPKFDKATGKWKETATAEEMKQAPATGPSESQEEKVERLEKETQTLNLALIEIWEMLLG